jgi:hypothetical protein
LLMESLCQLHRVLLWRKDCSLITVWPSFRLRNQFAHVEVKHILESSTSSTTRLSVSQSPSPIDLWILRNRNMFP